MLLKFRIVCWQTVLPPGRDVGRLRRIRNLLLAEMGRIPSSLPEVSQILFRIGRPEIESLADEIRSVGALFRMLLLFCNDETDCHPASFRFRPDFVAARPLCDPFDYRDDLFVALQHVDSIFIGHGVGPIAISGVALSMPLMNIASAFGSLIGIGAAALTSIRLGQGRREAAEGVLGNVVLLNFLVAALLRP